MKKKGRGYHRHHREHVINARKIKTRKKSRNNDREAIDYLKKLPLKKLRRRQEINDIQLKEAYRTKNTEALNKLRKYETHLFKAIDEKEFD